MGPKERCVSYSEGKELAEKYNIHFMEVSAKDNTNIESLFRKLTEQVIEYTDVKIEETVVRNGNGLEDLEKKRLKKDENKCCNT